jgi:hypothetical protein
MQPLAFGFQQLAATCSYTSASLCAFCASAVKNAFIFHGEYIFAPWIAATPCAC